MIIHSIDMSWLAEATRNNHLNNQGLLDSLRNQMDIELPDQNFTSFKLLEDDHPIKKTLSELNKNLTLAQKRKVSDLEKELVKIFNSTPAYTSAKTIKKWKEIGPLPLTKAVEFERVKPDFRYEVKCETNSTAKIKYCGQVNKFDEEHQHGIGRSEYLSGDMYEGEKIGGLKNGYGRYIWNNGHYYVGAFKNGKLNGNGLYVTSSGKRYQGRFKLGVFVN